ncbi:hypothetical protein ETAA8_62310 [Anatilimnocola aggregata]|uniref:DUF1501 domain-containing protein n=1 Tax=Anatilimnocola aggregata TaxID=2528021 RepID=A0A517YLK3_9BACT|nr:DUF1501 domain-containing protein [Anatilimnocola aggregata]QDU31078.1 hypothetical protein ETAA8_62310 [Anatilimnocola aggregata]
MLTILGQADRQAGFCDGHSRRDFLRIGGLGLGGLALPQLLQAEAQQGIRGSHKAIIMIFLTGGPPHQDMYDLKMEAPAEIRGPFQPIATNVAGIQVCEHLPRIAASMDKLVAIRSMVGSEGGHSQYQCTTGWPPQKAPMRGWPSLPAAVAKLKGPASAHAPPGMSLWYKWNEENPGPGFLGSSQAPFEPIGNERQNMVLQGMTLDRLGDRRNLLHSFDRLQREADARVQGSTAFQEQAFGILTSGKLATALDLSQEDPRIVARYGHGDPKIRLASVPQHFLMARRLVEAGARVVTLNHAIWDWHNDNFKNAQKQFPIFDRALTALVDDLHERGMSDDVTVLAWGEFGRTPKINKNAGRDHWPQVSCALLAGGGMRTGQVIGSTDRTGSEAKDRPVTFQEVYATLYRNLGIDVRHATIPDLHGRPQYLVEAGVQPLAELVA